MDSSSEVKGIDIRILRRLPHPKGIPESAEIYIGFAAILVTVLEGVKEKMPGIGITRQGAE